MILRLLSIFLVNILLPHVGFPQDRLDSVSNSGLSDIESYELQIINLESAYGPMDQRLVEPLEGLISRLIEFGRIDQVAELQEKQLAVMRANLGFESLDLLPVLRGMIQVQQALGNWEATSDILDHIRFLMAANYDQRSEETLLAMENQAQWKLAGFYLDAERNQSNNFLDARNLYADMERLAEDVYGENSPQLYPWYYKRAYNLGIMVQLLNTKGGFANVFITDLIRSDGTMRLQTNGRLSGTRLSPIGAWNIQDRNFVLGEGYLRQARDLINRIQSDRNSRRHLVSAWNVSLLDEMALPPCHCLFQFYVAENKISCQLFQRSADIFLGVPFNIASYSLLLHLISEQTGDEVGEFIWTGGDCHLYLNHIDQAKIQLQREPLSLPTISIKENVSSIFDYKFEDIEFFNYDAHEKISAPISV